MAKQQAIQKQEKRNITVADQKLRDLDAYLKKKADKIQGMLPSGVSAIRTINMTMMAAVESPRILEKCTVASIYRSAMQAASMGLQVGNGYNEAYLVPYGDTCTLRASYMGWVKIAKRSPEVKTVRASIVRDGDVFEASEHPPRVTHEPNYRDSSSEVIGAVAVAYCPDGSVLDFTFVPLDDLEKARKLADSMKPSVAWAEWPLEMCKKVAIRRLVKLLTPDEYMGRLASIENNADNGMVNVPDPEIDGNVIDMVMPPGPEPEEAPAPQEKPEKSEPKKSGVSGLKGRMTAEGPEVGF